MADRARNTLKIMETQTPFDLNLAIQRWREDLAHSSAFRSENLNELESHLRDSIDRLRTPQLSDEEAFLIATRRLGNVQRLEREYGKVNGAAVWLDRSLWACMAIPLWGWISHLAYLLWYLLIAICLRGNEILPGLGLEKIGEDWFRPNLIMGLLPIPIAIAIVLIARRFILPGSIVLGRLLHRPAALALTLFFLCAAFAAGQEWVRQNWYFPMVLHIRNFQGQRLSNLLFQLPYLGFWAALTFFAARKRLRSSLV
jgi:hypothetical protein